GQAADDHARTTFAPQLRPGISALMTSAARTIEKRAGTEPVAAAIVLGSGLSAIGDLLADGVAIPYAELEGFPGAGVSGHGRDLLIGILGGRRVAVLTGREHYY